MPEPLVPGVVRAQVVFQGTSNLPTDRYVNTFHFQNPNPVAGTVPPGAHAEIHDRLVDFYNTVRSTATIKVASFLSVLVSRAADGAQIRQYDLQDETPREPHVTTWTVGSADAGARLPPEVAICASFYNERNIPRQRGRIFLGPLEWTCIDGATGRPNTIARQTLCDAMEALAAGNDVMDWCTLSLTGGVRHGTVTAGWVDNEADTQRRRGAEVTARTTWP